MDYFKNNKTDWANKTADQQSVLLKILECSKDKMAKAIIKDDVILVNGKKAILPVGAEKWLRSNPEKEAFVKDDNVYFGEAVSNGNAFTKTGFARIVLTKYGNFRPVVRINTKGPQPYQCTYQQYIEEEGDIVLIVRWGHDNDPNIVFEQEYEIDGFLKEVPYDFRVDIPADGIEFLKPCGRGPSILVV